MATSLVAKRLFTHNAEMSHALRQAIEDWRRAGLTELPPPGEPLSFDAFLADLKSSEEAGSQGHAAKPVAPASNQRNPALADDSESVASAADGVAAPDPAVPKNADAAGAVAADAKLALLRERVRTCGRCEELAATRTQTVFGVGNPSANIMFIGEAPGADEDREGEPFVGKAGQLLDKIIAACGWQREELYICNILRCRPPGNRNPTDTEAANCREYLDGQIEAVDPEWVVCWGSVAAKNLLGVDKPIGRMRKQIFEYRGAKVLCTYHPSYLLRNPSAKKEVWSDLLYLFGEMGHTPPSRQS